MTLQWVPTFHVPMTTLIVTLPEPLPAPSVACAYATTGDGTSVARHGEAALSLLTAPAGAELVVVVPIQQLSWHRLELPRGTLQDTPKTQPLGPRRNGLRLCHGRVLAHRATDTEQLNRILQRTKNGVRGVAAGAHRVVDAGALRGAGRSGAGGH